jgi:hypothetical protein
VIGKDVGGGERLVDGDAGGEQRDSVVFGGA